MTVFSRSSEKSSFLVHLKEGQSSIWLVVLRVPGCHPDKIYDNIIIQLHQDRQWYNDRTCEMVVVRGSKRGYGKGFFAIILKTLSDERMVHSRWC
jgi:hypothetical protein